MDAIQKQNTVLAATREAQTTKSVESALSKNSKTDLENAQGARDAAQDRLRRTKIGIAAAGGSTVVIGGSVSAACLVPKKFGQDSNICPGV